MLLLPRNQIQHLPTGEDLSDAERNDSYNVKILASCWTVGVLSSVMIALRIYCKHMRSRRLWYDDYILITAWVSPSPKPTYVSLNTRQSFDKARVAEKIQAIQTIDIVLITVKVVHLGEGQHVWNLDRAVLPTLALTGNVSGTLSILAAMLSKTSFGVTLLRLSSGKIMTQTIWFLLATMNLFLGLSAIFIWAQCAPVAKNWRPELEGSCWDVGVTAKYGLFSGGEWNKTIQQCLP